ncbi:MAG: DNA-processing protein DprA [Bacteroidetes bacterium]|nr:DNA-processing protein DprA [Bacteroidota bacterium]MBU1718258.1 DNA-processing protein DprA [Bacteroidota bacterium]
MIPRIGGATAKKLLAYCGGAEGVFRMKRQDLVKIPGIGNIMAEYVLNQSVLARAEAEIQFLEKNHIRALSYLNADYPQRLKHCVDSPLILYCRGDMNLDAERVLAVVGTRDATPYGKDICREIIHGLKDLQVLIVSGLAYGIDIQAHRTAVLAGMQTVGVVGHGLDYLYPTDHKPDLRKMMRNGGMVSDFISGTKIEPENFPKRNRIIAGLSDAVLVIEAKQSGGALITAQIANSYNRDVFAVPGRTDDLCSKGCNRLISDNKAALVETAGDIISMMRWDDVPKNSGRQILLEIPELEGNEKLIFDILVERRSLPVDHIAFLADASPSNVLSALLNLEFKGLVRSLPGKVYEARR